MKQPKNDLKFNDVYSKNWEMVFNHVHTKVRNNEDAEDITIQVFERISRHLPEFDPQKAQLNTWILTIAKNLIIDLSAKIRLLNM